MGVEKSAVEAAGNPGSAAGKFRAKTLPDLKTIPFAEVENLVQELERHQEELEVQNEELQRAQQQREAILDRYTDLYDAAPTGYFTFDPRGLILEANLTGASLLGKNRDALLKTPFFLHVVPSYRSRFHRHLHQVFAGQGKQTATLQVLTAAGPALQVAVESQAVKDPEGNISQCYSVISDITAHQQAVDALRLTQFAVDRALVAVYWVKANGSFSYVNDTACASLGYSRAELLEMSVCDIDPNMSPEFWTKHWQDLQRCQTGTFQSVHCRKDGSCYPVEISTNYMECGEVKFNIAFAMDITRRKEAEEKIKTAVTFLENIIASSADAIGIVDENGRFTRWNQAAEEIYGYGFQDIAQRKAYDLYADQIALKRLLAQLKTDGFVQGYEIDMRKKDGNVAPFSLSIRLLRDDTGKTLGSVCVARDLTETKRSLEELNATNAKLRVLVAESDRRNRELTLINSMTEKLQSCLTEAEAFPVIAKHAQVLFPAESGALYMQHSSNNLLEAVLTWGDLDGELVFAPGDCWALRRGRLNVGGEAPAVLPCRHVPPSHAGNYLCLPLLAHGEILGMLHVQGLRDTSQEPEQLQTLAVNLSDHIAMALVNIRLRETLRHQAIHDALTGLFNRRYLEETLEREIYRVRRKQATLGLIMLDLDHFKRFNDSHGHEAGDELLRAMGRFLASRVRQEDVACRYGGEEFVLILPEADSAVVSKRAEDIRQGFAAQQIFYRDRVLEKVTISLGVAWFPDHGDNGQDVLRAADDAMYQAKAGGRNRVVVAPAGPT